MQQQDSEYLQKASTRLLQETVNDLIGYVYGAVNGKRKDVNALSNLLDVLEFDQVKGHKALIATKEGDKSVNDIKAKVKDLLPDDQGTFNQIVSAINNVCESSNELTGICNITGLIYTTTTSNKRVASRRHSLGLQKRAEVIEEVDRYKKQVEEQNILIEQLKNEKALLGKKVELVESEFNNLKVDLEKIKSTAQNEKPEQKLLSKVESEKQEAIEAVRAQVLKDRQIAVEEAVKATKAQASKDIELARTQVLEDARSTVESAKQEQKKIHDAALKKEIDQKTIMEQEVARLYGSIKTNLNTELAAAVLLAAYTVGYSLSQARLYQGVALMYLLPLTAFGAGSAYGERKGLKADMLMVITFAASAADCCYSHSRASAVKAGIALIVGVANWASRVEINETLRAEVTV